MEIDQEERFVQKVAKPVEKIALAYDKNYMTPSTSGSRMVLWTAPYPCTLVGLHGKMTYYNQDTQDPGTGWLVIARERNGLEGTFKISLLTASPFEVYKPGNEAMWIDNVTIYPYMEIYSTGSSTRRFARLGTAETLVSCTTKRKLQTGDNIVIWAGANDGKLYNTGALAMFIRT